MLVLAISSAKERLSTRLSSASGQRTSLFTQNKQHVVISHLWPLTKHLLCSIKRQCRKNAYDQNTDLPEWGRADRDTRNLAPCVHFQCVENWRLGRGRGGAVAYCQMIYFSLSVYCHNVVLRMALSNYNAVNIAVVSPFLRHNCHRTHEPSRILPTNAVNV